MENISPEVNLLEVESRKKERKNRVWGWVFLSVVGASFFGALFGFLVGSNDQLLYSKIVQVVPWIKNENAKNIPNVTPQMQKIVEEDSVVTDMVEKASPAVVSIIISKDIPKYRGFDPFGFFFQQNQGGGEVEKQKIGGGSGFLVTDSGMIVTNRHVVEDLAAEYTVVLNDGKEYPAKVLARDNTQDAAIIKIEGDNFPILSLGDSDQMKIGQTVVAIGNSLGEFSNTVSKGIISGLKRSLTAGSSFGASEQLKNIIQTDAAINPGNSGGPLLNINGEVIGVNVAMAAGAQNVGFAIPVNQLKKMVTQVKDTGKITTPYIGVRYLPIDKNIQNQNNLEFDYGVIVVRGERIADLAVIPGSPADKAGIVENDIILEVNGTKIDADNPLADLIANQAVGAEITLKIWHKGATSDVKAILEERK